MTIAKVNGKEIDLDKLESLTMRDWKELDKLGIRNMQPDGPEQIVSFVAYLIRRSFPDITVDDLDAMHPKAFGALAVSVQDAISAREAALDIPFSERSTS